MLFNYIVDPFQQFRKASWYEVDFTGFDERWLIPGMARNFDYDSVVLGASTEENIKLDMLSNLFHLQKPIKFVMAGSAGFENYAALNLAFHFKPNIKTVIYALRSDLFMHTTTTRDTFPKFLYTTDHRFKQALLYLTNPKTSRKSYEYLKAFYHHAKHLTEDPCRNSYNNMFTWYCNYSKKRPGPEKIFKEYIKQTRPDADYQNQDFSKKRALWNAHTELENLVKNHPETHFIFFYVPFSALYYRSIKNAHESFINSFEQKYVQFPKALSLKLLTYKNVEIHDLRSMPFVANTNAYYDLWHYDTNHIKLVLETIASKTHQLTPQNVQTYTDAFKKLILDYYIPKALSNQLLEKKKLF
ncbi:hypothetical protein NHP21005_06660 [Helicobacter sp. NHP21005]|nr:hypothetical protein NHP21005_06660 [Helicobacter sp. NHP21005]